MKTIKILLPVALTFSMFIGMQQANAQSSFNDPINNPILSLELPSKLAGLKYQKTLIDISHILESNIRQNYQIDYTGKVMIELMVNKNGVIDKVSFDRTIPETLSTVINSALLNENVTPVLLNGTAKDQPFKIPVLIK